jgi:hypothetical protein
VFRQDRANICSCCAVVYTFQVWWIVTGDVLREAPSFWRRSLWRWHLYLHVTSCSLACVYRRWCLQLQGKKSSLLLWSCKNKFLRNFWNCLPGFTVSQIFPPLLCRFSVTEGKAWQTYNDTSSACSDSNWRPLERQTSITDRHRSGVSERLDVGNSLSLCILIFFLTLGRIPCKAMPIM